jgi:hypothetical protein
MGEVYLAAHRLMFTAAAPVTPVRPGSTARAKRALNAARPATPTASQTVRVRRTSAARSGVR